MTRYILNVLVFGVSCLIGLFIPMQTLAQETGPLLSQEYFIRQAADEDLFIRINGFETEVNSRIKTQDGRELMLSGVSGSRLVPVFQFINAPEKDRQLDIQLFSDLYTGRSEFGIGLTRLKKWDERSSSVSRAYSLLSFGMQRDEGSGGANWTVKIDSLLNAERLFQQFGMTEMRLWSNYLAAHLIHFQLNDYSISYSMTAEILAELSKTRFQLIELATLQLNSAALVGLRRSGALSAVNTESDPIQSVLSRTNLLAASMDYRLEQALSLNVSGREYVSGGHYKLALEQFERAVEIADSLNDGELATSIRESIVKIYAIEGDAQSTSAILQKIETQLQEEGAGDELALNLLAQGRLQIRNYEFSEAVDTFYEALQHENDSSIRSQINLELARAFYQTDRLDESTAYLKLAGIHPDLTPTDKRSPTVDVTKGLWILSNIHRVKGEFREMIQARKTQGLFQQNKGRQRYDEGLDASASSADRQSMVLSLFRESFDLSEAEGDVETRDLSRLQLCSQTRSQEAHCRFAELRSAYLRLVAGGVPRHAAQAMFLWSKILVKDKQLSKAIQEMDRLVNEIHMFQFALPGVLGAWYNEIHEQIFEYYLELLSRKAGGKRAEDGFSSLLVLSKIRHIERNAGTHSPVGLAGTDSQALRMQLAQLEYSEPGRSTSDLNTQISLRLDALRNSFKQEFDYLSKSGLEKYLGSLRRNETVLTYHISPTTAQVWVGRNGVVRRQNIAKPAYIYSALQDARNGLSNLGLASFENKMDALGSRLLDPVEDLLSDTVYWIPAGPLLGFPLDALRIKGRFLAEKHTVLNLLAFPENPAPRESTGVDDQQKVFLAGYPQDYSSEYATRLRTSPEIQTVTDIFVGPGLTIVQGAALLPDEFSGEKIGQAQLIHLSMPGVIDLGRPMDSSLEVSGYEGGGGRARLRPFDILAQSLRANLVFLSSTRLSGQTASAFISQPGFVSDFLHAGANSVIARVWVSRGGLSESFVRDFYAELAATNDVAAALTNSKRKQIRNRDKDGLYNWAGYQLFID